MIWRAFNFIPSQLSQPLYLPGTRNVQMGFRQRRSLLLGCFSSTMLSSRLDLRFHWLPWKFLMDFFQTIFLTFHDLMWWIEVTGKRSSRCLKYWNWRKRGLFTRTFYYFLLFTLSRFYLCLSLYLNEDLFGNFFNRIIMSLNCMHYLPILNDV